MTVEIYPGLTVAGIGTHRSLLETCPVYHEIAASQLSEEELLERAKEITVYYSEGSIGYHRESTCYKMTISQPHTLYEAIMDNKKACSHCNPPTLDDLR